jgi:hypothetical protein
MSRRLLLIALSALLVLTSAAACTSKKSSDVGTGAGTTLGSKDSPGGTTEGGEGDFCEAMEVLRDAIAEDEKIDSFPDEQDLWTEEGDAVLAALDSAIADAPSGLDNDLETARDGFEAAIEAYTDAVDEDEFDEQLDDTLPSDFQDAVEAVSDAADDECGEPLLEDSGAGTTTTSTRRR